MHRRCGDRGRVLHHVDGRGAGVLGPDASQPDARGAPRDLRQQDRDAGETAQIRSASYRARRFRQARKLFRASGRPLDQAIPRFRNPTHSGSREADRVAAAHRAAAGARLDRSRRLSPRQHGAARHRAAGDRGPRLGAVDPGRAPGRLHLSADELGQWRHRRDSRSQGPRHSDP
ncbi:hypothetical protein GALL_518750 [mine drainage metagenome]|uniref:Uncharacterized protein n=1 Tax=mine drainage metagenome TaxID=410659 RepID=A0A1J5P5T3_9ZZZZ